MIVNVGDLMVDIFPPRRHPGGKAALYAAAQVLNGQPAAVVGAVGDDDNGRAVTDALQGLGVDVSGIVVVDRPTGWDEVRGESWLIERGANWAVDAALMDRREVQAVFDRASLALVNQGVPASGAQAALTAASERGLFTVLALAPEAVEPERRVAQSHYSSTDVLIVNRIEAQHLMAESGLAFSDDDQEVAAELWRLTQPRRAFMYCQGVRGAVSVSATPGGGPAVTAVAAAPSFNEETEYYIGAGDALVGVVTAAMAAALESDGDAGAVLGSGLGRLLERGVEVAAATTAWAGPLTCALRSPGSYAR